jgi:hypothetical protein
MPTSESARLENSRNFYRDFNESGDTRETVDERFDQLTGASCPSMRSGERVYVIVEDPDGIAIGLMSPIDPTRETPPPKEWTG